MGNIKTIIIKSKKKFCYKLIKVLFQLNINELNYITNNKIFKWVKMKYILYMCTEEELKISRAKQIMHIIAGIEYLLFNVGGGV